MLIPDVPRVTRDLLDGGGIPCLFSGDTVIVVERMDRCERVRDMLPAVDGSSELGFCFVGWTGTVEESLTRIVSASSEGAHPLCWYFGLFTQSALCQNVGLDGGSGVGRARGSSESTSILSVAGIVASF